MSMESMRAPESHERIGDWEVIEKFGAPKNVEHGTEDGVFIGKDFAIICDGVTSHTSEKINGLTPGQFAIHAAFEALKYFGFFLKILYCLNCSSVKINGPLTMIFSGRTH